MAKASIQFEYEVYDSIDQLNDEDMSLLASARKVTEKAYAPYSHFLVGAAAKLKNGSIVEGTNQENASFPVGICAERTLLASAAMLHQNVAIETMAIAYHNVQGESNVPVSPCGMCRQALREYEERTKTSIRLILSGMNGKVFIIPEANLLLPLSFNGEVLK